MVYEERLTEIVGVDFVSNLRFCMVDKQARLLVSEMVEGWTRQSLWSV
jgi:hypothetical protein